MDSIGSKSIVGSFSFRLFFISPHTSLLHFLFQFIPFLRFRSPEKGLNEVSVLLFLEEEKSRWVSDDDDDEPNDAKLNKDHFGGYIFIKSKPLSKKSYDSLPMWKANILLQRSVGRVAAFVSRKLWFKSHHLGLLLCPTAMEKRSSYKGMAWYKNLMVLSF